MPVFFILLVVSPPFCQILSIPFISISIKVLINVQATRVLTSPLIIPGTHEVVKLHVHTLTQCNCMKRVQTIGTIILHTHLPCLHFGAWHAFSNHSKRRRCDILTNFSLFDRVITILQHSLCAKSITGNLARRIKKKNRMRKKLGLL